MQGRASSASPAAFRHIDSLGARREAANLLMYWPNFRSATVAKAQELCGNTCTAGFCANAFAVSRVNPAPLASRAPSTKAVILSEGSLFVLCVSPRLRLQVAEGCFFRLRASPTCPFFALAVVAAPPPEYRLATRWGEWRLLPRPLPKHSSPARQRWWLPPPLPQEFPE